MSDNKEICMYCRYTNFEGHVATTCWYWTHEAQITQLGEAGEILNYEYPVIVGFSCSCSEFKPVAR
jgi:hypothetical protein